MTFPYEWIAAALLVGLAVGTITGALFRDLIAAVRAASRTSPSKPVDREVEHGPAFDLDNPVERARFEELHRGNGGRP